MIAEIITGAISAFAGIFFIGLPIFGWEEIKIFLTPAEVPIMQYMLIAVGIIGIVLYISGLLTLFNLIG